MTTRRRSRTRPKRPPADPPTRAPAVPPWKPRPGEPKKGVFIPARTADDYRERGYTPPPEARG